MIAPEVTNKTTRGLWLSVIKPQIMNETPARKVAKETIFSANMYAIAIHIAIVTNVNRTFVETLNVDANNKPSGMPMIIDKIPLRMTQPNVKPMKKISRDSNKIMCWFKPASINRLYVANEITVPNVKPTVNLTKDLPQKSKSKPVVSNSRGLIKMIA